MTADQAAIYRRHTEFRVKRQSSVENILYRDAGVRVKQKGKDNTEDRDSKLLRQERANHAQYVTRCYRSVLPEVLCEPEAFLKKIHEKVRKAQKKKKKEDGEESAREEDDDDEDLFGSNEESDDDYNINDYEGEDDAEGGDGEDGGGDY